MAIYDLGTASLAANGEVTGVGTTWKAPLTLIRVGATIVFKTEPVKIYTISEIISDTQINVYNPNSETVPAGTGYAILAHDGITVQGLAQDVAETLRYYQSRETEVADAVDAFNNFDSADFESKVAQVNTQHSDVVTIGAQVRVDSESAKNYASSASQSMQSASSDAERARLYADSLSNAVPISFKVGGTIESSNQIAFYEHEFETTQYVWSGDIPKIVNANSTPESTGGVSPGAWVKVGDSRSLRYPFIKSSGSFSLGGSAQAKVSCLFNESDNKFYMPKVGIYNVQPGSSPNSDWFSVGYLLGYEFDDPRNYGARAFDVYFDSSQAINECLLAFRYYNATPHFRSSKDDPAMSNLGGAVIDFKGLIYYIKRGINIVDSFNFSINNPSFTAADGYVESEPMLEISLDAGTRPINGVEINNPRIDANWRATGCILLKDFWKLPIFGGLLSRYIDFGLRTDYDLLAPHELNVFGTHIAQQPVWEANIPSQVTSGLALDINNFDNNYTGMIISQQVGDVARLRKGAGSFVNCHFYPNQEQDPSKGRVIIESSTDQFVSCYFDGCQVATTDDGNRFTIDSCHWLSPRHGICVDLRGSNPYQVSIRNCRFRNTTGTSFTESVIRMSTIAQGRVSRPSIRNNYTEGCTAISTTGLQYYNLNSTESSRVVTIDVPDQYKPCLNAYIQENPSNSNDDVWFVKGRLVDSGNSFRMRPYNMQVGFSTTATYSGGVIIQYNVEE